MSYNLDLFNWFLESNQKKGEILEGAKLVGKSNVSIVIFVPDFKDIELTDTAYIEAFKYEYRVEVIRKVTDGYELQLFSYRDNDLIINNNAQSQTYNRHNERNPTVFVMKL